MFLFAVNQRLKVNSFYFCGTKNNSTNELYESEAKADFCLDQAIDLHSLLFTVMLDPYKQ